MHKKSEFIVIFELFGNIMSIHYNDLLPSLLSK